MERPTSLEEIQQALVGLRRQLHVVDQLAAGLEHQVVPDVDQAHHHLRVAVEHLGSMTEGLFDISCAHDGIRQAPAPRINA